MTFWDNHGSRNHSFGSKLVPKPLIWDYSLLKKKKENKEEGKRATLRFFKKWKKESSTPLTQPWKRNTGTSLDAYWKRTAAFLMPLHFLLLTALGLYFRVSESLAGHLDHTLPSKPFLLKACCAGRTHPVLRTSGGFALCCLVTGSLLGSCFDWWICEVPPSRFHPGSQTFSWGHPQRAATVAGASS